MKLSLPPLTNLRFFEAAGRLQSFKATADALNVTPSAVSHGIQALETWLGVTLFVRTRQGLMLTEAGQCYLPAVREALLGLAEATHGLPGRSPRCRLAISAAPTFASRWLIPNLLKFRRLHPDIAVTIDTAHQQMRFPVDGVDLAIRVGGGSWPEVRAERLVDVALLPVCAPDYLAATGPFANAAEVSERATLIQVSTVSHDWAAWLAAAGEAPMDLSGGLRFDTIQLALEAAVAGLGVAIGHRPLVDRDLADGRLEAALSPAVASDSAIWLVSGLGSRPGREAQAFRTWIRDELRID